MIRVNENLLPINEFHLEASDGKFNSRAINFNELPVEEGEKYTLSFYGKQNEKGDKMTPYLPHKSKVKADNQAIFLSGGYSKRCIHSKLKTSRFRPVESGGGLC